MTTKNVLILFSSEVSRSANGYFFLCIVNFVCDDLGVKTGKNIYFLSELSLSFTDPPFQSHVLNQCFKNSQVRNSSFFKN